MFSLVSMKNAEQLNYNHQANKCNVFWFRERVHFISICLELCIQQSAMSFPCVFSITAAWLNVSHGAFSAPHPMLISCGCLLWDSEREGHHLRDREQRPALTVSLVKTHLCWEGHTHVILFFWLYLWTEILIIRQCLRKMIRARFELGSPTHNMPVQVHYSTVHISDNFQDFNVRL